MREGRGRGEGGEREARGRGERGEREVGWEEVPASEQGREI